MTDEQAIKEFKYKQSRLIKNLSENEYALYQKAIEALENQKIGHWESSPYEHVGDDCSVCGARWINTKVYKYCPSCGAKMVAVQGW